MPGFVLCERATSLVVGYSVVEPTHDPSTHVVLPGFHQMPDPTEVRWDGGQGVRAATPSEVAQERARGRGQLQTQVRQAVQQVADAGAPRQVMVVAMMEAIRRGTLTSGLTREQAVDAIAAEVDTLLP